MKDITIPLMLIGILADGECYSDEQLCKRLNISQARVNKYIQILCNWGVGVFSVHGKGYNLLDPIQLLNENIIRNQINDSKIAVLPIIDSTNQYLLERIDKLNPGDCCVAEYQQAGRGRRGRKWISPFGVNLYLSIFWRFIQGPTATIGLSAMISIVVAEILQELGVTNVRVKWPNDLCLHNRKLAGILVELASKTGNAAQVVIGTGINIAMRNTQINVVNQDWITLQEIGTSFDRNLLIVRIINKLRSSLTLFEQKGLTPFLPRWKKLDNFINRPVKIISGDKEIYGISRGINSQGALILEQDGMIKLWSGDISLRNAE